MAAEGEGGAASAGKGRGGGEAGLLDAVRGGAKAVGPVVTAVAVLSASLPAIGGFLVIAVAAWLKPRVESIGEAAPLVFALFFAVATGCALLPTYALSGVAGFIFGALVGPGVAMGGVVGGALIGYVLAALVARDRVMGAIEGHERARVVRGALVGRPFWTEAGVVTLLRLPPNSPFAMTNLVMASTRVRVVTYLIGTAVGIAPRTVLAAWLGAGIAEAGRSIDDVGEGGSGVVKLVGLAVSLVVVVVLYVLFSRWSKEALRRHLGEGPAEEAEVPDARA